MGRIVYVNGSYLPEEAAAISIFDRGFLFADAVYEVTSVLDGRLVDLRAHLRRLHRSLDALEIPTPMGDEELAAIHRELVERNVVAEGLVYLQVTRGAADRDFAWPEDAEPGLVLFTQARALADTPAARDGIRVISLPDIRWRRRDIKTVQLLAPSWCKMQAKRAGKDDAWLVEDGFVTEGTSNNAYIVTTDGVIVTRDLSEAILGGITRATVLALAAEAQLRVAERPFTVAEAQGAAEAFITAASAFVTPVVEIDGRPIGDGRPGPLVRRLRELYLATARREAE
jgi:D-alanine transaminase